MNQRQQLNQTPLSYAFGSNSRKNSSKPKPYLQINQFSNTINPTQEEVPPIYDDPAFAPNASFLASAHQNQFAPNLNLTMQSVIPFNGDQGGVVYYGDLQQQTSNNLQTFVKEPREKHCCMLVFSIILFVMAIGSIVIIISLKLFPWVAAQMIGIPYAIYFFFGLCNNPLSTYFSTMNNYSHIERVYQELKKRTGHIRFKAECYHFSGGKHRRRIVTHTAQQMIIVRECVDISEDLSHMKENNSYLFCKIKRYYCFADPNSHNTFINAFTLFKNSNVQDKHQKYTHTLDITIPDFADELGLSIHGTGSCLKPMYVIFLLLGLGYPYVMAIQCMTQRYSINLTKRLSL